MDSAQNNTGFYQHNPFPSAFPHSNRSTQPWIPPRHDKVFYEDLERDPVVGLGKKKFPWNAVYPPTPEEKPLVELVTFSPALIRSLRANPDEMMWLSPERLEDLVAELVALMNCHVIQNGAVNAPDGGVDFVAVSKDFQFCMAFQVKHHRTNRPTGIVPVRELASLYTRTPFSCGYLVTNTHFTNPAKLCAQHEVNRYFIRLRDRESLQRWLGGDFSEEGLKGLPTSIDLPGRIRIDLRLPDFLKK